MLVIFGGLPGTGKTTIAQIVARQCAATYIRIDLIEQAIRSADVLAGAVGTAGYLVGYGFAASNLRLGLTVIADSVNPLAITRHAWRAAAETAGTPFLDVEIVCSDVSEHRRRVEGRLSDIAGHSPPDWAAVETRHYEPWPEAHLVIDTAQFSAEAAASRIVVAMNALG